MNFSEMKQKMAKIGSNGGSMLHIRSEDLQRKQTAARIPNLKNRLKKKSMLLVQAELAFPFDPETGDDDVFNASNKYRPTYSATTVALAVKDSANRVPKVKEILMRTAGITEWDTSDIETFTETDQKVFKHYRVPRVFSVSAVHVDIQAMGTGTFGRDYAISVKRDDNMEVVGEKPLCLLANEFFRAKTYEEVSEYRKQIEAGIVKDTPQQQKEKISNMYGRVPVTDERPKNFVVGFEVPLKTDGTVDSSIDLANFDLGKVKPLEVISNYKKGIRDSIDSYLDNSWSKFDKIFDFFAIQINCPADGDDSSMSGKAEIGRNTKYERPVVDLHSRDEYEAEGGFTTDKMLSAMREYIDNDEEIEQRARRSMNIGMYDDNVESMLSSALKSVIDIDSDPYITKEVVKRNRDFLQLVLGEEAEEVFEEIEAGVSDKADGEFDANGVKEDKVTYDLSSSDFSDDVMDEFESLNLAAEQ